MKGIGEWADDAVQVHEYIAHRWHYSNRFGADKVTPDIVKVDMTEQRERYVRKYLREEE